MKKAFILLAILSLFVSACAAAKNTTYSADHSLPGGVPAPMESPALQGSGERSFSEVANYDAAETIERMVIKNATLTLAVIDPGLSMERVSQLAEEMGGYVVSANLYQTYLDNGVKVPRASITIRVPAEQLDEAMSRIKQETDQPIIQENISSQDITGDYTDLASRLRNLEAAEAQLQKIMDQAIKTEDVLSVYSQLTQVREQIELIKGQMQYYEQSVALSSISVELMANEAVQPLTIGGWQPVGVAKDALQALINGFQFLVNAGIWILLFVAPILLMVGLPPFLVIRWVVRWRRARKQKKATSIAAPDPDKG